MSRTTLSPRGREVGTDSHCRPCQQLGADHTHSEIYNEESAMVNLRTVCEAVTQGFTVTMLACGYFPASTHCSCQDPLEFRFHYAVAMSWESEERGSSPRSTSYQMSTLWQVTLSVSVQSVSLFTYKMWRIIPALLPHQGAVRAKYNSRCASTL